MTHNRFHVLDSWRGICALLVVLFHARFNAPIIDLALIHGSWQFVDFFFVLSGFVIAVNYRAPLAATATAAPAMSTGHFIWLRLARIYPLHLFMLLAFIAVELTGTIVLPGLRPWFAGPYDPWAIISNVLLIQSLGIHNHLTWNQPAWSIATEFWCYALFAVGVRLLGASLERWLVLVVIVCPLLLLSVTDNALNVTYDWGLLRNIYCFALGVLCWAGWRRGPLHLTSRPIWTLIELAITIIIVIFVARIGLNPAVVLGPPLFAIAVLVFAHARGALSDLLGHRAFLLLGTLSYSIYLIHTFILARVGNIVDAVAQIARIDVTTVTRYGEGHVRVLVGANPVQGTVLLLLTVALIIGASWLSYRFIERPAQKWLNDKWPRRPDA